MKSKIKDYISKLERELSFDVTKKADVKTSKYNKRKLGHEIRTKTRIVAELIVIVG